MRLALDVGELADEDLHLHQALGRHQLEYEVAVTVPAARRWSYEPGSGSSGGGG